MRLIASASIGVFRSAAKVKALPEHRGSWLGSNEGDAEGLRVVEIAQRYDLDRRYTAKTSGWQALEDFERERVSVRGFPYLTEAAIQ